MSGSLSNFSCADAKCPVQSVSLSDLDCFTLRTLLIHDYRRILLKDPRLPRRPAA